jgi:hypothetical protein
MRSRPAAPAALAAALLLWLAGPAAAQQVRGSGGLRASPPENQGAELALRLQDPRIVESSGLAVSRRHPAVVWTHNDSGDAARLFAVGGDGRTLATLRLAGVEARDWEAMAAGRDDQGRPALFVGDIGDNQGTWEEVAVYRVPEPAALRDAAVPAVRYRLRYADGPRDAEALLVDPRSNRLYVASKEPAGGGLYQAPARLRADRVNLLRRVAEVPPVVTDGGFLPDGRGFVLRDYQTAHVFAGPDRQLGSFPLPLQVQGESLAVWPDGRSVLSGSEGPASDLWRVPVPTSALPPPAPTTRPPAAAPPTGGSPPDDGPSGLGVAPVLALAAGALAALAGAAVALRRRR